MALSGHTSVDPVYRTLAYSMLTVALALLVAVTVLLAILYRQTRSNSFMCGGATPEANSRSSPDNTYDIYWLNQTQPARMEGRAKALRIRGGNIASLSNTVTKQTAWKTTGLRQAEANDEENNSDNSNKQFHDQFQRPKRNRFEESHQKMTSDITRLWQH